jgi:hypothetical protein
MAMQDTDFWRRASNAAPGLFDFGAGVYGMQAGRKEAAKNLQDARGPQYDALMSQSGQVLSQAGGMDPRAAAAERFNAQSGLLAGKDVADEAALMRMLHAKGMLGAANFNPGVPGVTPNGTAMNPHMAAYYAARGGRDAKMAADSLDAGEAQLDRTIKRSGMLQDQAAAQQRSGLEGVRTQPSRTAANLNLLKGASGLVKDLGGLQGIRSMIGSGAGLLGSGMDWLRGPGAAAYGGGGDFEWFDAW